MAQEPRLRRFPGRGVRRTISLALLLVLIVFDLTYWKGNWQNAAALATGEGWYKRVGVAILMATALGLIGWAIISRHRVLIAIAVFTGVGLGAGWITLLNKFQGAGILLTMLFLILTYAVLVWTTLRTKTLTPTKLIDKWDWWNDLTADSSFFSFLR